VTSRPYVNQADPAVAAALLGRSKSVRHRKAGCAVAAVAQAVRKLVGGMPTGLTIQQRALAAWDGVEGSDTMPWAAGSAAAWMGRLGNGSDVVVHDRINIAQGSLMRDELTANLKAGNPVLMAVDENRDDVGDHWVCALHIDGDDIVYADPDGGLEGRMRRDTLEGIAPNGKDRYRVIGIRVVTRA
jgi:hypothetical protein